MKSNFKVLVATFVFSVLATQSTFAGGGGSGPVVNYVPVVHCKAVNPSENRVRSLTYFQRKAQQWGNVGSEPGIYLEGDKFDVTIYSLHGKLHNVLNPTDTPEAIQPAKGEFYALDWNVRALNITVSGHKLSLSMVAGATGADVINNLQMDCLVPQ